MVEVDLQAIRKGQAIPMHSIYTTKCSVTAIASERKGAVIREMRPLQDQDSSSFAVQENE